MTSFKFNVEYFDISVLQIIISIFILISDLVIYMSVNSKPSLKFNVEYL